jgi:protoporphyrinogen oxidase
MILLFFLGVVQAFKVAIIGCGAGGSSAAYFLKSGATIFEAQSECGGRAKHVTVGDRKLEVGATMMIEKNLYFNTFVKEMGLKLVSSM